MKLISFNKRFLAGSLFIILLLASLTQSDAQNNGTFQNSVITNNTLVASSFINDNEGWLADNTGILWHTSNAGQSWSSVFIEKYFTKLQFINVLNGFGITSDAAYKTIDGGNTWSILSLPGSISNSLYFLDDNTGFITGNKMIYKTTNSGATWTTILTNGASFTDYYFINASLGIATANDNDLYQSIWRTTDGGLNWTNVFDEPNYLMNSIWFTDENTGWAVGSYDQIGLGQEPQIIHTTDGGLTWQNVYRNPAVVMMGESLTDIRFRNSLEGIAISNFSESVYTTDGGLNWNRIYETDTLGLPALQGVYRALDGYNNMYISGQFGYVTEWK